MTNTQSVTKLTNGVIGFNFLVPERHTNTHSHTREVRASERKLVAEVDWTRATGGRLSSVLPALSLILPRQTCCFPCSRFFDRKQEASKLVTVPSQVSRPPFNDTNWTSADSWGTKKLHALWSSRKGFSFSLPSPPWHLSSLLWTRLPGRCDLTTSRVSSTLLPSGDQAAAGQQLSGAQMCHCGRFHPSTQHSRRKTSLNNHHFLEEENRKRHDHQSTSLRSKRTKGDLQRGSLCWIIRFYSLHARTHQHTKKVREYVDVDVSRSKSVFCLKDGCLKKRNHFVCLSSHSVCLSIESMWHDSKQEGWGAVFIGRKQNAHLFFCRRGPLALQAERGETGEKVTELKAAEVRQCISLIHTQSLGDQLPEV